VYFVNIFEKLVNTNYETLLFDGIHLNSKGHQEIFKVVKKSLIDKQLI